MTLEIWTQMSRSQEPVLVVMKAHSPLAGIDSIWVVHYQGVTSIEYDRPQHQQ